MIVWIILFIVILVAVLCVWLKVIFTPPRYQCLTVTIPLVNTYRYHTLLDGADIRPIDSVTVAVGGMLRANIYTDPAGQEIDGILITHKDLSVLLKNYFAQWQDTILVENKDILHVNLEPHVGIKRHGVHTVVTLESLAAFFSRELKKPLKNRGLFVDSLELQSGKLVVRDQRA